ncbi:hypothetical protein [Ulvibacter antarcticus]|nr:hypothetical protein [Ulvibacter antarcticus]
MNTLLTVIFVVMVLIDGYLLYEFVQMIRELTLSSTHYVFTLISAMSFVFLGFLAILYNYIYSSKASLVFVLFVFTFIFAEVFRAIAYYDIAFGIASIHIARGLLLLSMCLLVHYCLLGKKDVEKLNQKLF